MWKEKWKGIEKGRGRERERERKNIYAKLELSI